MKVCQRLIDNLGVALSENIRTLLASLELLLYLVGLDEEFNLDDEVAILFNELQAGEKLTEITYTLEMNMSSSKLY